ncbi:MAG: replicative DNA helicase [Lachnospiraceae bacterium]|nr:replicative DNA helicase [Lachnospiraceae bacterium]
MPTADENVLKKVMPNSIEAEQAVIGSMILNPEAINVASELLVADDFYSRQYGIFFQTILEISNSGKPVDIVTLQDRLKEKDLPPEMYGVDTVRTLMKAVPTSANVKYYANIVAEKSLLRRMIRLNEEIAGNCYAGKESLEFIMGDTEKRMFQLLQERRGSQDFVPIRQIVMNAMNRIDQASRTKGSVTGIPTGFTDLDFKTAGLQDSDLVIIAARPAMGKTAFVLNIAQYVAFKKDLPVVIFSLEMGSEQLIDRMFSLESGVDAQKIRTGQLNDQDWERLIESAGVIAKSKLMIDDTPGITVSELRSKCRKLKLEQGLSLIIIDYLQLMSGNGRANDSQQQIISDISRSLKLLAREMNVPVLALSQLSRQVEQRPDHRPMLSDLRESGAIEQDADMVMFIYRDDYYHPDSEKKGVSEIIIAKQRKGEVGTVELAWLPEYTKFANLERARKNNEGQ